MMTTKGSQENLSGIETSTNESSGNVMHDTNEGNTQNIDTNNDDENVNNPVVENPIDMNPIEVNPTDVDRVNTDPTVENPTDDQRRGNESPIQDVSIRMIARSLRTAGRTRHSVWIRGKCIYLVVCMVLTIVLISSVYQLITVLIGSGCIDCKPKSGLKLTQVLNNDIHTNDLIHLILCVASIISTLFVALCRRFETHWCTCSYGVFMLSMAIVCFINQFYSIGIFLSIVTILTFVYAISSYYAIKQDRNRRYDLSGNPIVTTNL